MFNRFNVNKKIVIVTGELSGEIHASHLIKAMNESLDVKFSGIGSKKLEEVLGYRVHVVITISIFGSG